MDLTNIVYNFSDNTVNSLYENKYYKIPVVSNMATIKTELDTATGVTLAVAVVQYKDNLTVPRIVVSDGTEGEQPDPLLLSEITQDLTDELAIARTEVETEINNQLP